MVSHVRVRLSTDCFAKRTHGRKRIWVCERLINDESCPREGEIANCYFTFSQPFISGKSLTSSMSATNMAVNPQFVQI